MSMTDNIIFFPKDCISFLMSGPKHYYYSLFKSCFKNRATYASSVRCKIILKVNEFNFPEPRKEYVSLIVSYRQPAEADWG